MEKGKHLSPPRLTAEGRLIGCEPKCSSLVEISDNYRRLQGLYIGGGCLRPRNARRTSQQVLLQRGQFGFTNNHSKVVALKIVIGDVFHIGIVTSRPENSQENFHLR